MYTNATIIDESFPNATVYYSDQRDTYLYATERTVDNYYQAGDSYPLTEQDLRAACDKYPITKVVIHEADNARVLLFDITQYLDGPALPTDSRHPTYRYAPIEEAELILARTRSSHNQSA